MHDIRLLESDELYEVKESTNFFFEADVSLERGDAMCSYQAVFESGFEGTIATEPDHDFVVV